MYQQFKINVKERNFFDRIFGLSFISKVYKNCLNYSFSVDALLQTQELGSSKSDTQVEIEIQEREEANPRGEEDEEIESNFISLYKF